MEEKWSLRRNSGENAPPARGGTPEDAGRERNGEQALAGSNHLPSLFMQAPAAIASMRGPDHVFELVNSLFEQIVGRTAAQLVGVPGREALPAVTDGSMWGVLDRVYATGEPYSAREVPLPSKQGDDGAAALRWFHVTGQPTFEGDGNIVGVLIHAVDVTEQVRARLRAEELAAALESERARLSLGQRIGKIGTFDRDMVSRGIIWTPDLEALYGYEPGELQRSGVEWISLVHPDDRVEVERAVAQSIADGNDVHVEFRIVRKDGSLAWLLADGMVEYHADGSPRRVIGVNIDITDRKQAEDNLKFLSHASTLLSSSLDYETTLNTVAKLAVPGIGDWCSIDMIGSQGELQLVAVAHKDPARVDWARELRQHSPVDLSAAQGLPRVLRTGHAEIYPLITDEMLVATVSDERELSLARSLGMTSVMIVPMWSQGMPIGGITFVTTESRRRYTAADLAMAEELASRASLAIENARLYRQAQEALALRDEFISIASHELKTPVTSLKVYAQMLARQADRRGDVATSAQLAKMERQVDKLTRLIGDLLDVSKIEAGKLEYVHEDFDLVDLVQQVADSPKVLDQTHVIRVSRCNPLMVSGDRDRIEQVVVNLLTNAIKYSPGAERVDIELSCDDQYAIVAVRDFGIGIDPRFHEHIFDRFFQVSERGQRAFAGLGMGLYISREIARRHGGDLRIESSKGDGSTFFLVLPRATSPAGSSPTEASASNVSVVDHSEVSPAGESAVVKNSPPGPSFR